MKKLSSILIKENVQHKTGARTPSQVPLSSWWHLGMLYLDRKEGIECIG